MEKRSESMDLQSKVQILAFLVNGFKFMVQKSI
jgi:hypothetical protein